MKSAPTLCMVVAFACTTLLFWLGFQATGNIAALYDGLCPMQGRGMAALLAKDDPAGYCTGIGNELYLLRFITVVATVAVPLMTLLFLISGIS
jgi:hypothetical protein